MYHSHFSEKLKNKTVKSTNLLLVVHVNLSSLHFHALHHVHGTECRLWIYVVEKMYLILKDNLTFSPKGYPMYGFSCEGQRW